MFSIAGMFFIERKEVKRTPEEVVAIALLMGIDVWTLGHLYVIRPPPSGLESVELFVAAIRQSNPTGDNEDDI
ncbi:hypothetical protein [Rhizobium binae]|uniref:Uncharacterized protein n=1 Tax=Rhizobium binae TaxID=1138190 RepID=A0ABV2MEE4_9HYPH|nr:hypothetical protein [Rhizobium binae]NKL47321.1 hypothetical protein [Rhizobium leguminosarum bv. viciae]MBX4926120.1 hypothetical protein [Rhizobium binae]MBX4941016.1 hypothetical protein [Rhizobium binae]MBX4942421.1 hypothetical protein [Rhizobium binae]MBX4949452.1 hypothetical protein [Rhizobium binae]